jgi:tuftelin-interacting protein 11
MEEPQNPKKRSFRQQMQTNRKKPKTDDAPSSLHAGFGAKMLKKMGYAGTGGLGAKGNEGLAEPIAVKLRGAKLGLGAVKEKTDQQKREERRRAEAKGEKYEGSSEEERVQRKKKKAPGASTPSTATPRPKKPVFATFRDAGLEVPLTLQAIVDAASGESKATSSLTLRAGAGVSFETPLASRIQHEMAAFADSVEAVQQDAQNFEEEMQRLVAEMESLNSQAQETQDISSRLEGLRDETSWSKLVEGLQALQAAYPSRNLYREAVAVLHGPFKERLSDWDVCQDAFEELAKSLTLLGPLIDPNSPQTSEYQQSSTEVGRSVKNPLASIYGNTVDREISGRRSTPYQSMMLSWWTRFHSAIVSDLAVDGPSAVAFIHALEVWKPVLPAFILRRAMTEIKRKISTTLEQWNPRKAIKHKSSPPLPQWIFQWLPYHDDVFPAVKSKLRTVFDTWPIHRGLLPGIELWKKAFPAEIDQMLVRHLLPRVAAHLRDDFEVDPTDQKLEPLTAVTSWTPILSPRVLAELLHAQFFVPKFYPCLHSWLTFENRDFEEIGNWLTWWKDQFPAAIAQIPIHLSDWENAYKLVDAALNLDGEDIETLELPAAEPVRGTSPQTPNFSKSVNTEPPKSARQEMEETSFKDIVEAWCAEENLLLIPLRKADEKTGFPLFRITASATGKGGVVTYFKGEILYAQSRKDKSVWDPVGLDEGLIAKAEGK